MDPGDKQMAWLITLGCGVLAAVATLAWVAWNVWQTIGGDGLI